MKPRLLWTTYAYISCHDDVTKWKHFSRYRPFVRGIHRSPVNPPHKGQWRGALMFPLICVWITGWVNNREAGDLRCCRAHYDVTIMFGHSWEIMKPGHNLHMYHAVSRKSCIWFCWVLRSFSYIFIIVGFMWIIHPYFSGLLHWNDHIIEATLKDMGIIYYY